MSKVYIIAEAGVNHNGDIKLATQLIDIAKEAGADAVKFQTFNAKKLVSKLAPKAEYQKESSNQNESQLEMLEKLQLSFDDHYELLAYCKKVGIEFLSSPFDIESVDFLYDLGLRVFKIPSGEITNLPYLRKIGSLGCEVIASTGMATIDEIDQMIEVLVNFGTDRAKVKLLHCNTDYPTPFSDVNLLAIPSLKKHYGLDVGYSDHTVGIEVLVAAVALGATIIEKHFTLNREMEGVDHKASLEPSELKDLVNTIRNIEESLGSSQKGPSKSEKKNINIARKSIVAKCAIKAGDILSEENLTTKRPGIGISPMRWDQIVGQIAKKNFGEDDLIEI